jgi:hypothetical protein
MPYYRILIWIKQQPDKPLNGIRIIDNDIDWLQAYYYKKATERYGTNLIDCEVQMLSKTCRAVCRWREKFGARIVNMPREEKK